MKLIHPSTLSAFIATICARGARPFTIRMECPVKVLKKSRLTGTPWHAVGATKRSEVNCFLNFDYSASVNRQQEREGATEGTFAVSPNWFHHSPLDPRPVVTNNKDESKKYLQLKSERPMSSQYYDANGQPCLIPAEYLPLVSKPTNQGTEKPILTFAVSLQNIVSFTVDGNTYLVTTNAPIESLAEVTTEAELQPF